MSSQADSLRGGAAIVGAADLVSPTGQLDGSLRILSSRGGQSGTVIEVSLPLSHMLPPQEDPTPKRKAGL